MKKINKLGIPFLIFFVLVSLGFNLRSFEQSYLEKIKQEARIEGANLTIQQIESEIRQKGLVQFTIQIPQGPHMSPRQELVTLVEKK